MANKKLKINLKSRAFNRLTEYVPRHQSPQCQLINESGIKVNTTGVYFGVDINQQFAKFSKIRQSHRTYEPYF